MTRPLDDLLSLLPHRPPFRFITHILSIEPAVSGEAVWSVTGAELFLAGHFPGQPIVPGVLIAEALAQLSGLVTMHGENDQAHEGRLAHVDIRFSGAAIPPVEILLHSTSARMMGALHQFDVSASCNGKSITRGSLTLAIVDRDEAKTSEIEHHRKDGQ